jgi:transcriptional/translational regulatory protein YebC/TACO1
LDTFSKSGGNLGTSGSVAYMFAKRAQITFDVGKVSEDRVMEVALDAGASDVVTEDDAITVWGDWKFFADLLECFEREKIVYASAEIAMVPENTVAVSGDDAEKLMKLMEKLEELDDIQKVYANFDIDDATLAKMT